VDEGTGSRFAGYTADPFRSLSSGFRLIRYAEISASKLVWTHAQAGGAGHSPSAAREINWR
jgi:hypothetical protein